MLSNILRRCSWPVLLVAFLMALGMWYTVTIRDRLEAQIEVRLDYKGIPDNLVITDGLINKMTVRLRGPEALLRSFTTQNLTKAINLSSLKKGTNIIPLMPDEWKPAIRAFEVVEVSPPRLTLQVDSLMERTLAVDPVLKSPLGKSIPATEHVQVAPPTVIVRGPEATLNAMKTVSLNVPLDPGSLPGLHSQMLTLDLPTQVTASPNAVRVSYTVTSGRAEVRLDCVISVNSQEKNGYTVAPRSLSVRVEVPEALAHSPSYLNRVRLSATPSSLEPGTAASAPLRITMPEGMTLMEVLPAEVIVTRVKK